MNRYPSVTFTDVQNNTPATIALIIKSRITSFKFGNALLTKIFQQLSNIRSDNTIIIIITTAFIIFIILKMSLVVFDYDDTLFPTTYMQHHQNLIPRDLHQLDDALTELMYTIFMNGHTVIIVSNGSQDWITSSVQMYLPQFAKYLSAIRIVSARDMYEHSTVPYEKWKKYAMVSTFVRPEYSVLHGIIGVGDNIIDQNAIRDASQYISQPYKFVKLEPELSLQSLTQTISQAIVFFRNFK